MSFCPGAPPSSGEANGSLPTSTLGRAACCTLQGETTPLADGTGADAIPGTACGGHLLSQGCDDVKQHLKVERFAHQPHPHAPQQGDQADPRGPECSG